MIVHDRVKSDTRIEIIAQDDNDCAFVREFAAILANGGTIRLFANEDAEESFFAISFDGVKRKPTRDAIKRTNR